MENASKALLIAGAILLCILIIAIGMFIYNGAQSTITESMTTMSTQETEAFNNQFLTYEGVQKGTNIKNMLSKLIANANTYKDETTKIPGVTFYEKPNEDIYVPYTANPQPYIDKLGKFRTYIEANHEYLVEMNYQENGLIDYISVSYNPNSSNPRILTRARQPGY